MSSFNKSRLNFHSSIFAEMGYKLIEFGKLLKESLIFIISIIIVENDENSVLYHFVKNAFTFSCYLLRIVANCITKSDAKSAESKNIRLKLKKLSAQFKGRVEINDKTRIIQCYQPAFDDFSLTIDNKEIINLLYKFPRGFDFTIYSEHSESSESKRTDVFREELDPKLTVTTLENPNFHAVSNLEFSTDRQIDGTFEKVVQEHIDSFTSVLSALVQIFKNSGLAFIRESEIDTEETFTFPININGTNYVLVAYSLKSARYRLVDQTNGYLIKLYGLLSGRNMSAIKVTPDETYVKENKTPCTHGSDWRLTPLPLVNPNFDLNELFKTHTKPEPQKLKVKLRWFYKKYKTDVEYGLTEEEIREFLGFDLNNFVVRARILSRNENKFDKYYRLNAETVRFLANMYSGFSVSDDYKCADINENEIIEDYIFKFKSEILFKDVWKKIWNQFLDYFLRDYIPLNGVYVQDIIDVINGYSVNNENNKNDGEVDLIEDLNSLKCLLEKYIKGLKEMLNVSIPNRLIWSDEKRKLFNEQVLHQYKSISNDDKNKEIDIPRLRTIIGNCLFHALTNNKDFTKKLNFLSLNKICIKKFDLDLFQFNDQIGHNIELSLKKCLVKIYKTIFSDYCIELPGHVFDYCIINYFK